MRKNKIHYIFLIFLSISINTSFASSNDVSDEPPAYKEFCEFCRIGEGEICSSNAHPQHDPNSADTSSLYTHPPLQSAHPNSNDTLNEMRYLSSNPNTKLPLDMRIVLRNFSDESVKAILRELEIDPRGRPPRVALAEMLNRLGTGAIGSMCKNYCKKEYLFPITYGTEKWMFKIEHRPGLKRCLQKHYLDPFVLKNSKITEQIKSSHRTITLPTTSKQELDFALNLLTTLTRDNLHLWAVINYLKIFPNGTKLPFKDFWIQKYYDALKAGAAFKEIDPHGNTPMSLNPNSYGSPDALVESFSADIERTISMLLSYRDQLYSFLWFHPVKNTSLVALPQAIEMMSGIPSAILPVNPTVNEQKIIPHIQRPQIPISQHPFPPISGIPSASPIPPMKPQIGFPSPQQTQQHSPIMNPSMDLPQRSPSNKVIPQIKLQSWNVESPVPSRFRPLQPPHFSPQQIMDKPTTSEPRNIHPPSYNKTRIPTPPQQTFSIQHPVNTLPIPPHLWNNPPPIFASNYQVPPKQSFSVDKNNFLPTSPYPYNVPRPLNVPSIPPKFWHNPSPILASNYQVPPKQSFSVDKTNFLPAPSYPYNVPRPQNIPSIPPKFWNRLPTLQSFPWYRNLMSPVPYNMNWPVRYTLPYGFSPTQLTNQNLLDLTNSTSWKASSLPRMPSSFYYDNMPSNNTNSLSPLTIPRERIDSNSTYKYDPTELKKILDDIRLTTD